MAYTYLALCIVTIAVQNAFKKSYGNRCKHGVYAFSALVTLTAAAFFAVCSLVGGYSYDLGVLPYSAAFGVGYAVSTITGVMALATGSVAITSLILSYSLLLPTLYGIVFLGEPLGTLKIVGLLLLVLSLYLANAPQKGAAKGVSLRWAILVAISSVGNGVISIVQKQQLEAFSGSYKNEFMAVALLIGLLCLLPLVLLDRRHFKESMREGALLGVASGVSNGVSNLLIMLATALMPASVFYPVMAGGRTIFTYFLSITFYKERLTALQTAGVAAGVGGLVLLNM